MPSEKRASVTFGSGADYRQMQELARLMDCSESSLCALAVSEWLRENYWKLRDHYRPIP